MESFLNRHFNPGRLMLRYCPGQFGWQAQDATSKSGSAKCIKKDRERWTFKSNLEMTEVVLRCGWKKRIFFEKDVEVYNWKKQIQMKLEHGSFWKEFPLFRYSIFRIPCMEAGS